MGSVSLDVDNGDLNPPLFQRKIWNNYKIHRSSSKTTPPHLQLWILFVRKLVEPKTATGCGKSHTYLGRYQKLLISWKENPYDASKRDQLLTHVGREARTKT